MTVPGPPDARTAFHAELERARTDLHRLVATALPVDLRRGTDTSTIGDDAGGRRQEPHPSVAVVPRA
jgi:hypothetical protein